MGGWLLAGARTETLIISRRSAAGVPFPVGAVRCAAAAAANKNWWTESAMRVPVFMYL